jgi:tetratricopeptide (TPR) repeat protein
MLRNCIQMLVLASFLLAGGPQAIAQEDQDKSFTPKIEGSGPVKDVKKVDPAAKKGPSKPGLSAEDLYRVKPSASEEKLQAAIESLYRIIDYSEDDDPEKPVYYARLANLYWEKAETYFMQAYSDEMDKEVSQAEKDNDQEAIRQAEAKRELLLNSQKEWRRKAIKIFQEIEQKYPDYDKLDMVLFYLGNFSTQMGDSEAGYEYYKKLVTLFPESKYLPDAMVNVGEYFFVRDEFDTALEFYKRVATFEESRIYPFAIYKEAWCHYNMGDYEEAFKKFVEVIQYTMRLEKEGKGPAIGLKTEAQKDIVLAYSQIGKEAQAIPFFKSVAPDIYLVLAARLATLYADQGEYARAIRMYKNIISDSPDAPEVLRYQREIVENADKAGDKIATRKEIIRLVELYKVLQQENSPAIAKERDKIEELLRGMAIGYHVEAQKTMEKKAMLLAQEVYDHYLALFPEGTGRYQMLMNHAILLYQLEQYDKAVAEYERVISADPQGKYSREAAYTALLCYYKLIDTNRATAVKMEDEELAEAKEIPELYANMVRACDRFVAMQPEDPDELLQAKFASAKILYDFNHFKDAAPRLAEIIQQHTGSEVAPDAAKLLLSSYTMMRDINNLNAWADKIYALPALAQGEILTLITKIRDRAKFNRCFQYEFDKQHEAAADCFVDYTQKFPTSNLMDKSLYNAALNYQRARKYEKALKANAQLYNCCAKTSNLGPRALYLIAETYRAAAVYDKAAGFYEKYATDHPREAKVKEALIYASSFRRGLGELKQAIANYQRYMKLFRKDPKIPAVFFDIGALYAREGNWSKALSHFKDYLKKYRVAGGVNLQLAAYRRIGEAYSQLRKTKEARAQYDAVIETFKKLPVEDKKKITAKGISAIAWAYFGIADDMFKEAGSVKLTRKKLKEDTEKKMKILLEAEKYYLTVLSLQQPFWNTAALNKIGAAWEQFADDFENSPVPRGLNEMEQEEYKLQLSEAAQNFRKKAAAAYKKCLEEAKTNHIFNDYTEKAEQRLSVLEFQFAGMKEYRARPGYVTAGANPPGFKHPQVVIFQPVPDDTSTPDTQAPPPDGGAPGTTELPTGGAN